MRKIFIIEDEQDIKKKDVRNLNFQDRSSAKLALYFAFLLANTVLSNQLHFFQ